ncbi:lytic transglycosylase domain-containing protein [Chromobacterium piscinae]|uniref:Lytic transglycosylase domain-containing protein n=1 Tax=Chromobacterium piscinae TaxID=686831 RepID=A0ABV0H749_9NEIS|nr:lytic transglycosylase domain-containing protein [Chromobacterium piscinae]MBX9296533.1 lytic transglycosylase domain-containing protein [Chromobacterium vaccinii]MBX9346887.1 lytic transglycosylase domain-containing protein [Chromobacterium vaccinii]MBX9355854.1 lytic transglycosylase domain-containing protein [Chromobacterium vaccinii]MCD4505074.1 lytic transglycosylase domain-containing protein [Chromobacterium piscinae]MCD5326490.1 lytic transglycosylase domain-containing protein [Chrom
MNPQTRRFHPSRRQWAFILALLPALSCQAAPADRVTEHFDIRRTANCALDASRRFSVPYLLLMALKVKESGVQFSNPYITGHNRNGSNDISYWQINDNWLPKLARYNIDRARLYDPCVNVQVAAWLLSSEVRRTGSWVAGIGAYHSPTPSKAQPYAAHVLKIWAELRRNHPGWE